MTKRIFVASILLMSASLLLAACASPVVEETESTEKTVFVGPELVDCVGVAPQKCMQVKEDPSADYRLFYDSIEGFEFEEGYEYELIIREEQIENPPADASSIKWTLVEVVSKTPVQAEVEGTAEQTPEENPPTEGEVLTIYVGPELVECEGVAPQTCLQVKTNPDHDYTLFYDQIEGFDFEPGYEYELRVQVEPVENAPADASTLRYSLVEEVNRTPAAADSSVGTEEPMSDEELLEGTTWRALSIVAPNGQTFEVLPDTRITAVFDNGELSGTAGCNRYFGSYELDGNSLTLGPSGSTMMMCEPEEVMIQETAYLATLSSVSSFVIAEGQLELIDADGGTVLRFAEEEPISLTDVTWNLISYNNGQEAMVSVIVDTQITANFGEGGQLGGSAGCNSYTGAFETVDDSISIGPIASTQKFCMEPEGIMEQEMQYLTALEYAATYSIDGSRLEIRDADGAGVAYYEAAEASTLTGKTWNLLFHNNGQDGMVSTILDTQVTAVFNEDGSMNGSAGCNNYTATYSVDGDQIMIGPAGSTRKLCAEPEGIMEQESQYLAALENAAVYTIESNRLEIRDAEGAGVAYYEALEGGAPGVDQGSPETPETVDTTVQSAEEPQTAPGVSPETSAALANATYPLDYAGTGAITLSDGEFRTPAAEDSASEIITRLSDYAAAGEVSDQEAVAAIVTTETGGTGTFYDLVVFGVQDGALVDPVSAYLGDRIMVNSLAVENGQVVLDLVVQGPEDPFCCPTQQVLQTYDMSNGQLVQASSEVEGTVEAQPETAPITNIVWKWQELVTPAEQIEIESPDNYAVEFKDDGLMSITADCNVGSGTYELDGTQISVNITATTLALCPEGSRGDLFFSSLDNAGTYFMDGEDLMIDLIADGGTMRLFK